MRTKQYLLLSWIFTALVLFLYGTFRTAQYTENKSFATWTETCNWIGATGGAWETAANWNCNSVNRIPTATDQVVIDANVTVNINATTTIDDLVLGNSGGTTAPVLNFNYNAITSGALIIDESNAIIHPNAQVTHTIGATAETYKVNITVQTGDMTVTGTINVNEKGFRPGNGIGKGNNGNGAGGGAHGGGGGRGLSATGGLPYGSAVQPVNYGSGGGTDGTGLNKGAGGAIKITVGGTLTVSGTISSVGGISATGTNDVGSGAGGSIWITTATLSGAGTISANGGNGGTSGQLYGAGGGGRIALYYSTDSFIGTLTAKSGGTTSSTSVIGGAGTIYRETGGVKTILLDNGSQVNNDNYSNFESGLLLDILNITNNAYLWIDVSHTATTINLTNSSKLTIGPSANCVYTTFNWGTPSTLMDRGGTFAALSGGGALTVPATNTLIADTPRTYTSVTINGTLTHSANSTAETYKLSHTSTGDYTISATGTINVDLKGYLPNNGPGKGSSGNGSGGGGYGGEGGDGTSAGGGPTYGALTQPDNIGSGGGIDGSGLNIGGGGAIKLVVAGTLTINGPLSANGGTSFTGTSDVGSGSGGSIWLTAATLAGNSTASANGGMGGSSGQSSGSGGGGRIALYYTTDSSSVVFTAKAGGTNSPTWVIGAAGTIYRETTAGVKTVLLDNGNQNNNDNFANLPTGQNLDAVTITNKGSLKLDGTNTFGVIELSNTGKLRLDATANITYTTFNWSTSGHVVDRGGVFSLFSSGGSLTVPSTTLLFSDVSRSYSEVIVNGTISTTENTTTELYKVNHTVSGNYTISSTGILEVDGKGLIGANGTGKGGNGNGAGGAGYGGEGGNEGVSNVNNGGTTYGSLTDPTNLGSGGGNDEGTGLSGGGAIILTVGGIVSHSGLISADGETSTCGGTNDCGGGSGGSVNITAGTVSGNGTITANGSNSYRYGGAGGGGRIAVKSTTDSSSIIYQAYGGSLGSSGGNIGAPGTIYIDELSDISKVILDNTTRNPGVKKTGALPASLTIDELYIRNYARLHLTTSITVGTIYLQSNAVLQNEATGNTTYNTLNWTGVSYLVDRGGVFPLLSSGGNLTVPANATLYADTARSFNSASIDGTVTHTANTTTEAYKIAYTITTTLTVNSAGKIDVSGKGFSSSEGTGPGTDSASGSGGGAYGGNGGAGNVGAGGIAYGSATAPANLGSGGGQDGAGCGGAGGGNITLNVSGTVTIAGSLLANGSNYVCNDSGGGAGGTINMNAGSLAGNGTINAKGGNGLATTSGGGGGGRIAIYYSGYTWTGTTLTDVVATSGGTGKNAGAIGTVYLESSNQLPEASGTTIDSGNAAINLTAGSTTAVSCTSTVTDLDGYLDIASVNATLYRTSIGYAAADSDNNHYSAACTGGTGSGTSRPYTCNFAVWFHAEGTDAASGFPGDNWSCRVTPQDGDGTGTPDTDSIELNSISALQVSSNITFSGSMLQGTNTGSTNETTDLYNVGNTAIDIEISGNSLCTDFPSCTGSVIPVGNLEHLDTPFTYNTGVDLTSTPVLNSYNIGKSSVHPSTQLRSIYWGIGIPAGLPGGSYTGLVQFTAVQH